MMFTRSRVRIALGYVSILTLILVFFSAVVVIGFWRQASAQQDRDLAQEAENKKGIVYGGTAADSSPRTSSQFGWVTVGADGRPLGRTTTGSALGLPYSDLIRRTTREERSVRATVSGPAGDVRTLSLPVFRSGTVIGVVQVAQSREVVRGAVRRLVFVLLPMGLVSLALAAAGGLLVSGRAMRPISDAFDKQRTFVADASHELKTPLTLIKIDAEVLNRVPRDRDDREILDHLLAEIDRMDTVLSDLLVLARLDAGTLGVAREPFNLAEVVVEAADRFSKRSAFEGVGLAVDISGKLPVRGDAERTGQILAALLDNALRYTQPGGTVTMVAHAHDGRTEASIADSGPGIPAEHLERIFDRFYRADVARTRQGGGTGLGLAIARGLARAQDGDLTACNAKEGGAVFRLSLPTARGLVDGSLSTARSSAPGQLWGTQSSTK